MSVYIQLFGLPKVRHQNELVAFRLNSPTLLLVYLAVKGDWVSRSELAFLFRPDDDEVSALKQVRLLLYRAKQIPWAEELETDPKRVRFKVATDLANFQYAVKEQNWPEASKLYSAAFLADYSAADLPTYTAWLELERSELESNYQLALSNYASDLETQGNYAGAADVLYDLLKENQLAEEVLQPYLKNLYLAGQRDRALKAYQNFCQQLLGEYGAEPSDTTQDLVKLIRSNTAFSSRQQTILSAPKVDKQVIMNLPQQSTRFIGRQSELRELGQQLRDDACRLLTLIGLGGTGKSRLSLELARLHQSQFTDGVCFVALAPLTTAEAVMTTIAQALGVTLAPKQEPKVQVIHFLQNKRLLLLLDNFEHLLDAAPMLADLLEGTEHLKLLVTSRERLRLSAEWLYDLEGLRYPTDLSRPQEELESFDSVQLFISSTKRVAPKLDFSDDDIIRLAMISQQVQGLPLALELAASWTRVMPVARIAKELAEGYDLLTAQHSELPERHRNITAIFDKTWAGLSEKKRQTLIRFSVFQGGATLEAAEAVAETHFTVLLSLVNESLLRRIPPDRFDIHPLTREYAARVLATASTTLVETINQHASYFSTSLKARRIAYNRMDKADQEFIGQDLGNFIKAFYTRAQQQEISELVTFNEAMYGFFSVSGRLVEGLEVFDRVLELTSDLDKHLELADLKFSQGQFLFYLGQVSQAITVYEQVLRIAEQLKRPKQQAVAHHYLADCYITIGEFAATQEHLSRASLLFKNLEDWQGLARTYNMLGNLFRQQGEFHPSREYYLQSLDSYSRIDSPMGKAVVLNNLGNLAEAQQNYQEAQNYYLECLEIFEAIHFVRGIAAATTNLGVIYYKLNNYEDAKRYTLEGLRIKEATQDKHGIILSHLNLATVCVASGQYQEAEHYALKGYSQAIEQHYIPLLMASAETLVRFCQAQGEHKLGQSLIRAVLCHPNATSQHQLTLESLAKVETDSQGKISTDMCQLVNRLINLLSQSDAQAA